MVLTNSNGNELELMTVAEVAALLRISSQSCYRYIAQGVLPSRKIGRRVLLVKQEVLECLQLQTERVQTGMESEIEQLFIHVNQAKSNSRDSFS